MLEPLLLRTGPSLSTLPMREPLLLRTVPSLSILPIDEPLLLRTVPSLSILPTPLKTVISWEMSLGELRSLMLSRFVTTEKQ